MQSQLTGQNHVLRPIVTKYLEQWTNDRRNITELESVHYDYPTALATLHTASRDYAIAYRVLHELKVMRPNETAWETDILDVGSSAAAPALHALQQLRNGNSMTYTGYDTALAARQIARAILQQPGHDIRSNIDIQFIGNAAFDDPEISLKVAHRGTSAI